jgi:hypothetical protein
MHQTRTSRYLIGFPYVKSAGCRYRQCLLLDKSCRKMHTIFSAVLRQQKKSDVMTYFGHPARSAVYCEVGSPLDNGFTTQWFVQGQTPGCWILGSTRLSSHHYPSPKIFHFIPSTLALFQWFTWLNIGKCQHNRWHDNTLTASLVFPLVKQYPSKVLVTVCRPYWCGRKVIRWSVRL